MKNRVTVYQGYREIYDYDGNRKVKYDTYRPYTNNFGAGDFTEDWREYVEGFEGDR